MWRRWLLIPYAHRLGGRLTSHWPRVLRALRVLAVALVLADPLRWVFEYLTASEITLSLHDAVVRRHRPEGPWQLVHALDGEGRAAIFAHPPSRLEWALQLRAGHYRFNAELGLQDEVWGRSDGVVYRLAAVERGVERELSRTHLAAGSPKAWRPVTARFSFAGGEIVLVLETSNDATSHAAHDGALWAEPRIAEETAPVGGLGLLLGILLAVGVLWSGGTRPTPGALLEAFRPPRPVACGLAVVATLLLFEGLLRLFPPLLPVSAHEYTPGGAVLQPRGQVHDPETGFLPAPAKTWSYRIEPDTLRRGLVSRAYAATHPEPIEFATDRDGFRNPRELAESDIVAVGDSFVENGMVQLEESWTSVLAAETGRVVRNLGVGGFAPQQSLTVLRRVLSESSPETVLFLIYEGNDVGDSHQFEAYRRSAMSWPEFLHHQRRFQQDSLVVRRLSSSLAVAALRSLADGVARRWGGAEVRGPYGAFNPVCGEIAGRELCRSFLDSSAYQETLSPAAWRRRSGWPLLRDSLKEAQRLCDEAGARLLVVLAPDKVSIDLPLLTEAYSPSAFDRFVSGAAPGPPPPSSSWHREFLRHRGSLTRVLKAMLAAEGIAAIDLRPGLERAAAEGRTLYFPFDSHWNAEGNLQVGLEVAAALRTRQN